MHKDIQQDPLLSAVASLSQHDVDPAVQERIRKSCHVALQQPQQQAQALLPRKTTRRHRMILHFETAVAATISIFYLLGMVQQHVMILMAIW